MIGSLLVGLLGWAGTFVIFLFEAGTLSTICFAVATIGFLLNYLLYLDARLR